MGLLKTALRRRAVEFYLFFVFLWVLPVLVVVGLGVVYLWQEGWFWWFSLGLVVLALSTLMLRMLLSDKEGETENPVPHLEPIADWSDRDNGVWETSLKQIDDMGLSQIPWEEVPAAVMDHLGFVAHCYNTDEVEAEYAFTLPELLLMLEIWGREYRAFVTENVPLVQKVKISTLLRANRAADSAAKAYTLVSPVLRIARVIWNPASGATAELRTHLFSSQLNSFGKHMQRNMKIALFEQVTQVAIDLYSGRLQLSEQELAAYRSAQDDDELVELKPLSVLVLGQINAGKSSLINSLRGECSAEVDVLPATGGFMYHRLYLADSTEVTLIDSPGVDGNAENRKTLIQKATECDLLLWLSQANQPAKALDKEFIKEWRLFYERHPIRRMPPVLLITTHNDQLSPKGEWNPPYDLADGENSKVNSILGALTYAHEIIGLSEDDMMLPVSLAPGRSAYNVDVLYELLLTISEDARAAQLNRERLDAAEDASVVLKAIKQCVGLVAHGARIAAK